MHERMTAPTRETHARGSAAKGATAKGATAKKAAKRPTAEATAKGVTAKTAAKRATAEGATATGVTAKRATAKRATAKGVTAKTTATGAKAYGSSVQTSDPLRDLRWDDVRVLLAVLRTGSFTAAARRLGTDQSTISRRIAALEAEVGVLFERGARGPRPTELAERWRPSAERIDDEMHLLADLAAGTEPSVRGRVRLATSEGLAIHALVPEVLPALQAAHPELRIEIATSERAVDLASREADVALRFFRGGRGDLVIKKIATIPTAVLARRSHARRWRGRSAEALPWIVVDVPELDTPEAEWVRAQGGEVRLVCTSYEVQLAAIRVGLGVGVAPLPVLRTHRELVALEGLPPGPPLELFLVTRRAIRHQPRIAAVMAILEAKLAPLSEV